MKLRELDPQFLRISTDQPNVREHVAALEVAQGVLFLCPKCFAANGGPIGTHSVMVWFRDRQVPEHLTPAPRWAVSGTGLGDLTLTPSILLTGGCGWHGFVTAGSVTTC